MDKIKVLQVGDILGVRDGKSFVARGISYYMRKFCKKHNILYKKIYHHNARVVDIWGELFICEANAKGVQTQKPLEAYSQKDWDNRIDIFRPIIPYTEAEKRNISKLSVNYSNKQTRYDFLNQIYHIIYIKTGKWIGPKGKKAEYRMYCSELIATVEDYIRQITFKENFDTNKMMVVNNNKLTLIKT